MSKIAHYLNTHMLGEVTTNPQVLAAHAHDASLLTIAPEMVAYPRVTNDVRKIARFSWELAEKGHVLPITPRGAGTDKTGGAIGKGIVVSFTAHMNQVLEFDAKQKLVRLQPGAAVLNLQNSLEIQGAAIEGLRYAHSHATMGGLIASTRTAGRYVDQLEVILASGDVIQTRRLSKRELAKKKGQPGIEGDIYRDLDALIEENVEVLGKLQNSDNRIEHFGYASLETVKYRDGSFDLTPLFLGSQGSLGIVSEMILRTNHYAPEESILVATFSDRNAARDAFDAIQKFDSVNVEYIDGAYFTEAARSGKTYPFVEDTLQNHKSMAAVIWISITGEHARGRKHKLKKLTKALSPYAAVISTADDGPYSDLNLLDSVTSWYLNPEQSDHVAPPLVDGIYIPLARFEDFAKALDELAKHHHVTLPLYGKPLESTWYVRPTLRMTSVGDKQKALKLMKDITELAARHGGTAGGDAGEGRFHFFTDEDADVKNLYASVKQILDPQGILNPGVKFGGDLREIAKSVHGKYVPPAATDYMAKY